MVRGASRGYEIESYLDVELLVMDLWTYRDHEIIDGNNENHKKMFVNK